MQQKKRRKKSCSNLRVFQGFRCVGRRCCISFRSTFCFISIEIKKNVDSSYFYVDKGYVWPLLLLLFYFTVFAPTIVLEIRRLNYHDWLKFMVLLSPFRVNSSMLLPIDKLRCVSDRRDIISMIEMGNVAYIVIIKDSDSVFFFSFIPILFVVWQLKLLMPKNTCSWLK